MEHKKEFEAVSQISTLFLDIGGVLLSDGWDHESRKKASELFKLDYRDMEKQHHLNFEIYELGKMSLDDYLERVVFLGKEVLTLKPLNKLCLISLNLFQK